MRAWPLEGGREALPLNTPQVKANRRLAQEEQARLDAEVEANDSARVYVQAKEHEEHVESLTICELVLEDLLS